MAGRTDEDRGPGREVSERDVPAFGREALGGKASGRDVPVFGREALG